MIMLAFFFYYDKSDIYQQESIVALIRLLQHQISQIVVHFAGQKINI